jgi:ribonuclease HI
MSRLRIYCDGGARGNPGPSACAFVVFDDKHKTVFKKGTYLGGTTNNVAEYSAVIDALLWLNSYLKDNPNISYVEFYLDSNLVVNQLLNKFKIKDSKLIILSNKIKVLTENINNIKFDYLYIPRSHNQLADNLVNYTLDNR